MIFLGVFRYFRGKHLEMWTFPQILVSLNTLWHLQIASYTFKDFPQVHLETTIFPTYTWRFPSVSQNIRRIRIFFQFHLQLFSDTSIFPLIHLKTSIIFPRKMWRLQSFSKFNYFGDFCVVFYQIRLEPFLFSRLCQDIDGDFNVSPNFSQIQLRDFHLNQHKLQTPHR